MLRLPHNERQSGICFSSKYIGTNGKKSLTTSHTADKAALHTILSSLDVLYLTIWAYLATAVLMTTSQQAQQPTDDPRQSSARREYRLLPPPSRRCLSAGGSHSVTNAYAIRPNSGN
ncbi:hypothetical protein CPC08DRAFT_714340 [Agrocybe pediades]|nr:hypothetical protein CPC08DRAFT_714340 [Agrocybe pediades]